MIRLYSLLILFLISSSILAQTQAEAYYELTISGYVHSAGASCGSMRGLEHVHLIYTDGTENKNYFNPRVLMGSSFEVDPFKFKEGDKKIKQIKFHTNKRTGKVCNSNRKNGYVDVTGACFYKYYDFSEFGSYVGGYAEIKIIPKVILKQQTGKDQIFSEDKPIIIPPIEGIHSDYFTWQYFNLEKNDWFDFPLSFQRKNSLRIQGSEFGLDFSSDFHYGKQIQIRVKIKNNCTAITNTSNAINFTYLKSAPHIESLQSFMETCYNRRDAIIEVHLDRPILEKETVRIAYTDPENGLPVLREGDKLAIDDTRKKIILDKLSSGTYDLRIYGNYKHGVNERDTIPFYTDGEKHRDTITIAPRPKVTYSKIMYPVNCFDGSDGKVGVKAFGGVGKYEARITKDDNSYTKAINLDENVEGFFNNLKAGNYIITLRDTNFCFPQLPDSAEQRITVSQPLKPLQIVNISSVEAKGFGRSDGEVSANVVGGTKNYTLEWRDSSKQLISQEPQIDQGEGFLTKAKNLKAGWYYLYAYDNNYESVNPKNDKDECGCMTLDSVYVDEPPLLTVNIEETRYITCHGDSDGELTAHVRGGRTHLTGDMPYTYKWSKIEDPSKVFDNDSIISTLSIGNYIVEIEDRNGIIAKDTLFLDQPDELVVSTKVIRNNDCAGGSNGSIEVIASGGIAPYTYEWSTMDTTRVIDGLSQGRYFVTVRDSRFKGNILEHHCSVQVSDTITDPAYIEVDTLYHTRTSCHGGQDGKIHIKAKGGRIGQYTAYLVRDGNTLDSISFAQDEVGTFIGLSQGGYKISIKDSNDCVLTNDGVPFFASITVTEPTPVQVLGYRTVEPLGFGLSNGSAQVTFKGGSAPYTVVWIDEDGNTIPQLPLEILGDTIITKVENVRSANYYVTIKDSYYSLAEPQNEINTCGCTDTISLFVPQPTPLRVNVEELRYVTCNGDKDGAIVAHAKGGRPFLTGYPYRYNWYKIENSEMTLISSGDSTVHNLYSGYYKVEITDRNGITKLSDEFHLVEPEPLIVTTQVLQGIACQGDNTGVIEAFATGGTPPYSYIWSTNDTTKVVSGLSQGYYVVGVRDARYQENILGHYCFAQVHDSIIAPNSIKITADIKHPTCNKNTDGTLDVKISGGVPPYDFVWEDTSEKTLNRLGLKAGAYTISVFDSGGCSWSETFEIVDPDPIIIDLGKDFTLCKDQTVTINGRHIRDDLSYQWIDKNGTILSTDPHYDIVRAGTYKLSVESPEGCQGEDEITVLQANAKVEPDFVLSTQAANNIPVIAVNITRTEIDSLQWLIPDTVSVLAEEDGNITLLFPENGEYSIGMVVYKQGCEEVLYKLISIVDEWELDLNEEQSPFITNFYVTPNPNNGYFEAVVELREATDYSLHLLNSNGLLLEEKKIKNGKKDRITFDKTNLATGLHFLMFKSKEATSVFKIIVK